MNGLATFGIFLPVWMMPWLVVGAIAAWIVGAYRLAVGLSIFVTADLLLVPLLKPYLTTLPAWVLALITILLVLMVIHGLLVVTFGREAAGNFTGTWLVRIGDLLLLGPLRFIGILLRNLMIR